MKRELLNYDVYPKVFPVGKAVCFTVKPLGGHAAFEAGKAYTALILTMNEGSHSTYPCRGNMARYELVPADDGCFHLIHTFETEGEYYIRILKDDARVVQLSVYAIEKDLVGRYPYMGDLHMHSTMSDGKEHPYIVAANYRKFGYDFMALTDHRKFYPSLELMKFYEKLNLDIHFYPYRELRRGLQRKRTFGIL